MKVLVINHSSHIRQCISALAQDDTIESIKLGTPRINEAVTALQNIDRQKIQLTKVNATDPQSVAAAAADTDLVVDMTKPWMTPYIQEGARQAKVNYIDPRQDMAFWQNFVEGNSRLYQASGIVAPQNAAAGNTKMRKGF